MTLRARWLKSASAVFFCSCVRWWARFKRPVANPQAERGQQHQQGRGIDEPAVMSCPATAAGPPWIEIAIDRFIGDPGLEFVF